MTPIAPARPSIGEEEILAVQAVMSRGDIAAGPDLENFETSLARRVGRDETVATGSGFSALFLLLKALDIGSEQEVILPVTATCSSVANAVRAVGATPVYADVGTRIPNLNRATVEACMSPRTRAIITIHHLGYAEDPAPLRAFDIPIIEDCAQALGAGTASGPAGALADFSFFSFYATKIITTIDGGAVSGNDPEILHRVRDLRSYDGKTDGAPRYNLKMQNLHAALGRVQLARLDAFIAARRQHAQRLYDAAAAAGWPASETLPTDEGMAAYRAGLFVDPEKREALLEALNLAGIPARIEFMMLHPDENAFTHAGRFTQALVTLPTYPALTESELVCLENGLKKILPDFCCA